jgi:hypothetical protein
MSEAFKDMIEPNSGKNPAAFARRSALSANWRHVREKFIASGTGNRSFDVELLRLFAQSRMTSVPALAFIALSAAVMSFMWTPEVDVVVWLGIVWSCHLVSYKTARSLLEQPEAGLQVQAWRRRFVATELCHGLAWAMLTVLFLNEPDSTARVFVLFVLLLIYPDLADFRHCADGRLCGPDAHDHCSRLLHAPRLAGTSLARGPHGLRRAILLPCSGPAPLCHQPLISLLPSGERHADCRARTGQSQFG